MLHQFFNDITNCHYFNSKFRFSLTIDFFFLIQWESQEAKSFPADAREATLMCLSIGTPKIIHFPFVPNGKFIIFRCPKIKAEYSLIIMCVNIGTHKTH